MPKEQKRAPKRKARKIGIKIRVKCPKCKCSFDYYIIPMASFTSLRLGTHRYMRCQKCGKFALFDVHLIGRK